MSERLNIIEEAETIAENYTNRQFEKAFNKLYKEQHGQGCGCLSCKTHAVREINSWVDFIASNPDSECLHYKIEPNPKGIDITGGLEEWGDGDDTK